VLLFRTTAKQARLPLSQHLSQHVCVVVTRVSTLIRSVQLLQSTSSLLSSTQLFRQPPSAVANLLRIFRLYAYLLLSTCTFGPPGLAWFHPPAWLSTSLHECPPTCTCVHLLATVSTNLQGCPAACQTGFVFIYSQLDSRCTDKTQARPEQTCSLYLNTHEEDAAVILQGSKAPAETKLLCCLIIKVTIPAYTLLCKSHMLHNVGCLW
jgi:hypothetical protein